MIQTVQTMEVPPLQFNKAVDIPVVAERQIRTNRKMEVHQMQHTDQVIDVPVVLVAQVPLVRVVTETVEIPQSLFVGETMMIPEIQTLEPLRV